MALGVVPDDFALTRRLAAVERAIEERYSERLAFATPRERKQLVKQMKQEIGEAIKEKMHNAPWWQRGCAGPWIR